MARPPIDVALYPDVPAVRGVPQLRRPLTQTELRVIAFVTAAISGRLWQSSKNRPRWGIYDSNNELVIEPDSFLTFDNRNEFRVSDFPVQQGAFATYNKVASPFEVMLRLSKSGSLDSRTAFLNAIDSTLRTLALFTILTPERSYTNVNLIRYEVTRRGKDGAYFLTDVDLYFREIRQVAAQYSTTQAATRNAQQPSATPPVNDGIVQPVDGAASDGF